MKCIPIYYPIIIYKHFSTGFMYDLCTKKTHGVRRWFMGPAHLLCRPESLDSDSEHTREKWMCVPVTQTLGLSGRSETQGSQGLADQPA